ncbi:glutamate/gamma-aminobutyrate antiporter [Microbulbifer aestuariivivens]|uniref:Glutamate/gamma-aminobutyrate antiporter n=1 Tax=Microbulbifer aestuariivivens TaxID=1908308 RepID=A0ABP9WPE4_9GAMM
MSTTVKTMGWLTLSFMMVAAVASIRSLPTMAVYGLGSIFLYLIPAFFFFIPVALVAAELGTGWNGGVYGWVKQAYGNKMGFFSIWYLWMNVITWYPIVLAFAASAVAYLFNPELAKSGVFTAIVIVVLYWLSTFVALGGLSSLSKLSSWFMVLGTLLPALVLIVLGVVWLATGHQSEAPLTLDALIPDIFKTKETVVAGHHRNASDYWQEFSGILGGLVLIVGNFLAYAGIEMNAIHARSLSNPQGQMPKAIALAAILIALIFIPPTLAISFVVPADSTSLTAGVMQAYTDFFTRFHIDWAIKIMAVLLIIGALGGVLTWTAGPSAGLLMVARSGEMPLWWQKTNSKGVQKNILFIQAVIVSLLAVLYVVIPNVSAAFWMLSAIAAQIYLSVYILMFLSALKLRKTQPNIKRGFRCPAIGFWARLGLVASLFAMLLGFVPPAQYSHMSPITYILILLTGLILFAIPPFIFHARKKPGWQVMSADEVKKNTAPLQDLD